MFRFYRYIIATNFRIFANGSVVEEGTIKTHGRTTFPSGGTPGSNLTIRSAGGQVLETVPFDAYFDYYGPMEDGVDYAGVKFDSLSLSLKVPYDEQAATMEIYNENRKVFSKELNFCNSNGVCDTSETSETCPQDCPAGTRDRICTTAADGVCDPDCRAGVDPDCAAAAAGAATTPGRAPVGAGTILAAIGAAVLAAAGMRRN
jgi:hypothetical protein